MEAMGGEKKVTGQFTCQAEVEKTQFPSFIPTPWNAGIVLVTAGFQSTLKCNWTLKRQTDGGVLSRSITSLACHSYKQPD